MKKIYSVNNSKVVLGLLSGLKSRITTGNSLFTMLIVLMIGLFGVNETAWGAWSGSGQGVKKNGTWYVLYEDGVQSAGRYGSKEYSLSGPGLLLTFEAKNDAWLGSTKSSISVADSKSNALWSGNVNNSYASKTASNNCHVDANKITFTNNSINNISFQKVHVTMAQYLNNPTKTDLDCGTADINSESTSGQVNVAWCNVPAMSYEITDDAEGLFSVSVDVNSEAGKYNTSHFTVTYKHTKAGTHTAKLKITDSYNSYSKTVNLTGTTNKLQPTVTWSSNDAIFNVDDELSASNSNDLTVTLSGNSTYVTCTGNTAVMKAATSGTITLTAHVAGNDIYADKDFTKDITITNLEKQHITWTQDFSRLKTTDGTKSITLSATASSGLPVSYELSGDKTGLSLTQSGNTWTLTYLATECKNTTIVAKQAGNGTYAPASNVSLPVKVIDPTKVCDANTVLVNSQVSIKSSSVTYNIDIPETMTVSFSRMKTGLLDWYTNGLSVEFYSGRNGTGTKLYTKEYSASDIDKTLSNSNINLSSYINAKSVKITTNATNGYYIDAVSYTHRKYCNLSTSSLAFETFPNTATSSKSFNVNYANYPIFVECSNAKFTVSPTEFGDCGDYGTQPISVSYTAGADEGEDSGVIYIKDNTGVTLKTCSLSVEISKLTQSITSTSIQSSYNTTDRIELSAEANSGLTYFEYSATPAGVASFAGNVMTFSQSGTIAITATQPGSNVYAAASATVENVKVNKVTPTIATEPSVSEIKYLANLTNGEGKQLSAGLATVTLRGVADSEVDGTFSWTNPAQVTDAAGNHNYSVTFTPTDGGMYNSKIFDMPVTISRADGGIEMNNGEVKVKVAGINDDLNECKIDLNGLIQSKIEDAVVNRAGVISFEVIGDNKEKAGIENGVFSATAVGAYSVVATQAQTSYYEEAKDTFTITVNKLTPTIVFDNTDDPEYIYSGDEIEQPAARMYNGKEIDRNVISYVSSDMSNTGAIYVNGTTLTARNVTAPEGSSVNVTITASTTADALYNAASVSATHNYAVRAKRSPVFTMEGVDNAPVSKTLNIGEQAIITYNENTNEFLTVGTASEHAYVSFVHEPANRRVIVTAVKGTVIGDGVQEITVNQPGNDYLFPRNITYTFTVKKNVSTLSLAGLTTAMEVEDTVATPYTGLANTAEDVQFSCSPEGSMKMENGKLIALQAGTNTVTFSQPATEYWTGISQSKTITVSKKNPNMTTKIGTRHAWYSIIEHPFKSLNTEKELQITSSNESLAKYIKEEDKIYVYGTSGNVTFTVNQEANYKYNAVENYQKTFEIFQPNNRLPFTLSEGNLEDYTGGSEGDVSWNDGGVLLGGASGIGIGGPGWDYSAKYIILSFVGIPDVLSFDFKNANWSATQYGWHFYQSNNGSDWIPLKEYEDLLMNATGGTSEGSESLKLNPNTRYVKLEYHGNFGGRFKNVSITERKEIVPQAATTDFGLGFNGNDPTTRTIKVDWYNVKPCTVTITGADADKFVLGEGSNTIYSMLDNYGMAELTVSYKHETNSVSAHTANLHIEDADGNYADVALSGQTTPAPQTIIWRSDLTPMPINGEFADAAVVASGQPIMLSSDHPEIVRVDANNTLVGVAAGTAHVTATAEGNNKWAETTSYIDIEVTTKNVQFITWNDNLSNRKREDGQTVNITLTATSTSGLPITYELDEAAQAFASISGNVLRLTGWGKGQVIAKQVGNEDYVAVQAVKSLISRNPAAGCKPLVGEYSSEYTIWTLGEKEIELNGEPATIEFDAKCDGSALYGLWVGEFYDDYYHEVVEIKRLEGNNLTSSYKHFGPFALNRNTTKVKIYTKTGATMNRTFKEVEVVLAKYLELADNQLNFSQVDKGSTKTQSFYINYSNLTGVLDVELENASTQFEVLTTTVGEDCGDAGQNVRVDIRFTGSTEGTENNKIIISNKDQRLEIPVSATVVLPSQAITWEPELNVLTTDHVVLSATATSELPVSFTSGNTEIAEVVYEAGVYSLDIKSYGDVAITAHQPGDNENWSAATDKTLTFHISRVVPEVTAWPTAQVILPNTVGGATLIGGIAPEGIAGSFNWEDESLEVTRQAHTFNVVFVPNNTNYYEPVSHPLEIEILKTPQTITWNRANESEEGCSNVVILDATASSNLPITYHSSDSAKAYAIKDEVNNVMKLYILKGGDVTITAEQPGDETYAAAPSVSKTITLIRVIPTIETLPTATDMFVHHFLSNSTPQGGLVKAGENIVTGVFNWANGAELMDTPGTNQRTVVFHPYNSDFYQEVSATIDVEVLRFAPTVLHNFTTETKVYGTKLSEFTLSGEGHGYDYTDPAHLEIEGTFSWKNENYIPSVSDAYATMIFHPTHTEWYDDVEIQVPIQLNKATIVSATATANIYYGQVLSEAVLVNTTTGIVDGTTGIVSGIITWDPSLNPMEYYTEGTHPGLPIRFTPTDPNYESVEIAGTAVLTVEAGYVFDGNEGTSKTWGDNANWMDNAAPENNGEKVVILADVDITSDVTVESMTIKDDVTVTVKDGATLTLGASASYVRATYGNLKVESGGQVVFGGGVLKVNDFVLEAQLGDADNTGKSGQVFNPASLDVRGNAYFDLALDPSGECSKGWYDFTVPFPVDALNGVTRFRNSDGQERTIQNEVNYAIMDFSESRRLETGYGWKKYRSVMQSGQCYTITIDDVDNVYRFKKVKDGAFNNQMTAALAYTDVEDNHRGWNGLGNGTMAYIDLNAENIEKVQVYCHETNSYTAIPMNSYTYVVGSSFFVQAPTASSMMEYSQEGATHTLRAPKRETAEVSEFTLTLAAENATKVADRFYVSASEEASDNYTIGRELTKFGAPTDSKTAQMWTNAYGMKLCDVELSLVNNEANCELGLFAPKSGVYEIAIENAPEDASLYLTYNDQVIWDLTASPYVIDLAKGTTEGYGLRIAARAPQIATGVEETNADSQSVRKVLINNTIYLVTPEGKMYDIVGKSVKY